VEIFKVEKPAQIGLNFPKKTRKKTRDSRILGQKNTSSWGVAQGFEKVPPDLGRAFARGIQSTVVNMKCRQIGK
jgi:hypothetical protein